MFWCGLHVSSFIPWICPMNRLNSVLLLCAVSIWHLWLILHVCALNHNWWSLSKTVDKYWPEYATHQQWDLITTLTHPLETSVVQSAHTQHRAEGNYHYDLQPPPLRPPPEAVRCCEPSQHGLPSNRPSPSSSLTHWPTTYFHPSPLTHTHTHTHTHTDACKPFNPGT